MRFTKLIILVLLLSSSYAFADLNSTQFVCKAWGYKQNEPVDERTVTVSARQDIVISFKSLSATIRLHTSAADDIGGRINVQKAALFYEFDYKDHYTADGEIQYVGRATALAGKLGIFCEEVNKDVKSDSWGSGSWGQSNDPWRGTLPWDVPSDDPWKGFP